MYITYGLVRRVGGADLLRDLLEVVALRIDPRGPRVASVVGKLQLVRGYLW